MDAFHRSFRTGAVLTVLATTGPFLVADVAPVGAAPLAVTTPAVATPAMVARAVFDRMTPAQRVGQLFMVGGSVTGLGVATTSVISRYHVGNLILTGRTYAGAAPVRALASKADALTTNAATAGVPLFIATDQEGGFVQVLQGSGFSRMPSALVQGRWSDSTLTSYAASWGRQVARAGVDVNLAPVMDTVSSSFATRNAPIGRYNREFGYTPPVVADKGTAFLRGMRAAGLAVTAKHFPGLGRVTGNTDVTAGVTDTVTTSTSADIGPFRAAVGSGAGLVMVSSAVYSRIDPHHPAVFSRAVITGMIRAGLRFNGVVVSDDLGNAAQVRAWSPGARAVDFISAGGDIVLTVNPSVIPAMVAAVSSRAAADSAFRAQVNAAVLRVLGLKAGQGLLAPRLSSTGVLTSLTVVALQRWLSVVRTGRLDGLTVRALQSRIGTTADGLWGPASMAALQSYLGTYRDGARTWNARTVVLLQTYLNTQL
jgi:beta-N-acetylhexosaminidase